MFNKKQKHPEKKLQREEMHRVAMDLIKKRALVFLLWLFSKQEMHGYELIRLLKKEELLRISPKPALIYPMLNALCKKGLLVCRSINEGKRKKKVYATSKKGLEYIEIVKKEYKNSRLLQQFVKEVIL